MVSIGKIFAIKFLFKPAKMLDNKMVKGIKDVESSIGTGGPRQLLESEKAKRESLRRWKTYINW